MSNIGINVIETDGKATPSIQGAPTSVAAFILTGLCAGWIYKILVVRKILGHFLDGSGGGL